MSLASYEDASESFEELLPSTEIRCSASIGYNNVHSYNLPFAQHLSKDIYVDRSIKISRVRLFKMPRGSLVLPELDYMQVVEGAVIAEQYPVYFSANRITDALSHSLDNLEHVASDAVLIARFGIYTWGHWAGELLPKAALVEALFPGAFTFVVPTEVFRERHPDSPWSRIRESLEAYGITSERVVLVSRDKQYMFDRLYCVESVWSDHMIHPQVVTLLNDRLKLAEPASPKRIAIQRHPRYGRMISNSHEVYDVLRDAGYTCVELAPLDFRKQASLFHNASHIFGVLGSDLTGLLFAREGVNVVAAAPANFGDRFFYALTLARRGKFSDLRGEVVRLDPQVHHKSDFYIKMGELRDALSSAPN